jgi:transmembrane sensor
MADANELLRRIARVGADIDPALSERDVERLVEGARRRRQRRTVTRVGAGTLAVGIATLAFAVVWHERRLAPPAPADVAVAGAPVAAPAAAPAGAIAPLRLADGSVATPLDEASALSVREDAPQRVAIDLVRGRGRFDVTPRPERPFSVRAGDVTITVLGTVFTVERVADRIGVSVTRGRVLVDWGVGARRLDAGESGWFPPLVVGQQVVQAPAADPAPSRSRAPVRGAVVARADVMAAGEIAAATAPLPNPLPASRGEGTGSDLPLPLAGEGRGEGKPSEAPRALPAPRRDGIGGASSRALAAPLQPAETAETLLAAADAARLQGRAEEGAALLRRIVQQHRADPRAPLAAFTLGRVLLMELAQPRQAAAAFAEARALAPHGPFAEDALAREVEAWAKAGDDAKARARAQDYLRAYPSGRRVPAVRALGGGE